MKSVSEITSEVGAGKTTVSVYIPLHGSSYAVSVAKMIVIAHADFIPVINNGGAGKRKEEDIHNFYLSPVISKKRGKSPPDTKVYTRDTVFSIDPVHIIFLLVSYHFQGKLVMVS
mgnify:CR=1 FL=1